MIYGVISHRCALDTSMQIRIERQADMTGKSSRSRGGGIETSYDATELAPRLPSPSTPRIARAVIGRAK